MKETRTNAFNERRHHRVHGCIGFLVGQAVGCDWRSSDKVSDVLAEWPPAPATDEDTEASFPLNGSSLSCYFGVGYGFALRPAGCLPH
jgi:hypothetical protein